MRPLFEIVSRYSRPIQPLPSVVGQCMVKSYLNQQVAMHEWFDRVHWASIVFLDHAANEQGVLHRTRAYANRMVATSIQELGRIRSQAYSRSDLFVLLSPFLTMQTVFFCAPCCRGRLGNWHWFASLESGMPAD